ncbi:hypothetical protein DFH29DRAFT_996625 [Suillus ampliporus]|nr:hypothetical protein DFH29DRAFT_996625 [Suillus ampliporus]
MHARADLGSTSSATSAQSIGGHTSSQEYDTLQQSLFQPFNDTLNMLLSGVVGPTLSPKMGCRKRAREDHDENTPCTESEIIEARKRRATSSLFSDSNRTQINPEFLQGSSRNPMPSIHDLQFPPAEVNKRSLAQQQRRACEHAEKEAMHCAPTESVNKHLLGQQRRRAHERAEKERSCQVATPIVSNELRAPSVPRVEPPTPGVDVDIPVHLQLEHEHAEEQIEHGQPHHHSHEPLEQHPLCGADVLARPHSPLRNDQNPAVRRDPVDLPIARRPYVDPCSRHDLGQMTVVCPYCQALHWMDERLSSSSKSRPLFGICCDQDQLFETHTPEAIEFRSNIRQYNAALAFTSLGVNMDHAINAGRGPHVFRIHGQLCHHIGHIVPSEGCHPVYAQLYIYDPHMALDERMQRNENLCRHTMERLQTLLIQNHRYATIFRHAHEILSAQSDDSPIMIRLLADPNRDHRRYNLPTVSEIAAVIPGDGTETMESHDIILH